MPRIPLAIAVLFALTAPSFAQQPAPGRAADPALNPVPTDSFAFVSVKAAKLWDNPATKPFRDWAANQKDAPFDKLFGVPPADLDRVTAFVPTADPSAAPLVLVTTRQQYNEARVLKTLGVGKNDGRPGPRAPGRVAQINSGGFEWVAFLDDRTMLFLPTRLRDEAGPALIAQLLGRKADGPLAAALIEAQAHDFAAALDVRGLGAYADELELADKRFVPYLALLKAKTAVLTADFDRTARFRLVMTFPDADTARRAAPVLEEGIKSVAGLVGGKDEGEALPRIATGWAVSVLKGTKVTAEGASVVAVADVPYADDLAKAVAALPKSLNLTRDTLRAQGHLKQLAIALHSYHDAINTFPGDVMFFGGNNTPAMSWRVQILPFIEQDTLYKQLDVMKPWDDPKNLKILQAMEMPKIFEHPGRPAPKGHTYFRIFTLPKDAKGKDRPFSVEGQRGPKIASITDGLSNTFMIVEAGEAVPWYKPDVLPYDGKLPLPQLGDKESDTFLVVLADGGVYSFRRDKLGEKTLRAAITIAGGEVVQLPFPR